MLHFNYYPTSLLRASDFKIMDKKIYGATGVSKRGRKKGNEGLTNRQEEESAATNEYRTHDR